jgi:hypothetical protein
MATLQSSHPLAPPQCSRARQRLIAMIEQLGFGHIDNLHVIAGEPQQQPPPRCTRVINLTAEGSAPVKSSAHGNRSRTLRALFRHLDAIQGSAIVSIVVQHGLPVRLTIHEPDAH